MFQPIVLYISLKFFIKKTIKSYNFFISLLSIIGISIGIMSLIIIISIMNGIENKFIKNTLNFIPHIILTSKKNKIYINDKIPISKKNLFKYVKNIEPIIREEIILQNKNNFFHGSIIGINSYNNILNNICIKKKNKIYLKKFNIIIGQKLANKLRVKINSNIKIIIPSSTYSTSFGYIPIQKICKIDNIFYINNKIDQNQILMNKKYIIKLIKYPKNVITGWRLWLKNPLKVNEVTSKIFSKKFKYEDWRKEKGDLFKSIILEKNIIIILLFLISIVSNFNIITLLMLQIYEKKIEISILKNQGLTNFQIINIFFLQGFFIGIIGSFLGTILGIFFTKNINNLIKLINISFNEIFIPSKIKIYQIIIIISFNILITLFMNFFTYLTYYNINISEVLKNE